jgi:ubiquinol-cytochrome c reductase cytochrome c1 subunit
MMRYILTLIFFMAFAVPVWAEGEGVEGLKLAVTPLDYKNIESIKRGAKFFATNCMMCHTLTYLRYDPIATEAGISADKTPKNLIFNGVTPPDLSLEADARGENWLYTYLHSFYQDKNRPSGVNNLLVPNTAMPNQLAPFQGEQVLVEKPMKDLFGNLEWYDIVKLVKQGSMTPEQFDGSIADVVNFLAYAAEPYRIEQQRIGWWVLGFLVLLFVMMYLLKKEYWKDVKKLKE